MARICSGCCAFMAEPSFSWIVNIRQHENSGCEGGQIKSRIWETEKKQGPVKALPDIYYGLISTSACFCFCSPGLRKAAGPAPAGIIEALPVSIAEAFPVCLAPGACTDVPASTVTVVTVTATVVVSTAASGIAATAFIISTSIVVPTRTTTVTSTTTPTTTSTSKATHISHSPFLLVCTISYGTHRQSVTVSPKPFSCHGLPAAS